LTISAGHPPPIVWETNAERRAGAAGYPVIHPDADIRRDYRVIVDVSGDASILDRLIGRLARGGEIVLAGFYEKPLSFDFAPSFLREARMRVAAEFKPEDMTAVVDLINDGRISLDDLITHHMDVSDADQAYRTAFGDASCLKMILDWRGCA
jgi:3-hydroxyethyl bacteriochlorophyllide a dehydrogenase